MNSPEGRSVEGRTRYRELGREDVGWRLITCGVGQVSASAHLPGPRGRDTVAPIVVALVIGVVDVSGAVGALSEFELAEAAFEGGLEVSDSRQF